MPKRPALRDPDKRYPVDLCGHCRHPAGMHIFGGGCRLCADCPGWDEAGRKRGTWSDRMTDELLAAMGDPAPGRKAALSATYKTPAVRLVEEALHLRMYGEYAPGGTENWRDWERRAEAFLRSLPPEPREDEES